MNNCIGKFSARYSVPEEDVASLVSLMTVRDVRKGEFLIRTGETDRSFYIIRSGIWRGSHAKDGESRSLWFASEGEAMFSIWCYMDSLPSLIDIEAMSDGSLYCIGKERIEAFFNSSVSRANCGRNIFERHMLEMETWMITSGAPRAKERYLNLLKDNPELLRYVPLKYIASYLWVTPQSLSRIRAEISNEG